MAKLVRWDLERGEMPFLHSMSADARARRRIGVITHEPESTRALSARAMYNLVIVGGGFAGTKTAQLLEDTLPADWALTLISQENFITFNPLLPEVVGASIMPSHVIAPHRQMIHCSHVCMAQVSEI